MIFIIIFTFILTCIVKFLFARFIPIFNDIYVSYSISFFIMIIILIIKNYLERVTKYNGVKRINPDDYDKFYEYNELLKYLSIAQIGYLIDGKNGIKRYITSSLEKLIKEKRIYIREGKIEVILDNYLTTDERYLLDNLHFLNDKRFIDNYANSLELGLLENAYIEKYKVFEYIKKNFALIFMFILWWIMPLSPMFNTLDNGVTSIIFALSVVLFIVLFVFLFIYSSSKYHKTDKGIDIYKKILSLKYYLLNSNHFSEKLKNELIMWNYSSTYEMLLKPYFSYSKELKEEYNLIENAISKKD